MAINGYLKKVMRKIIIILLASTSYFSCNNYQNEALVDEFITTEEVAVEELVVEEVVVEETPERIPCEESIDLVFGMNVKFTLDQFGVLHKEYIRPELNFRIVYQPSESRIIIYKKQINTETLYKIHKSITCELCKINFEGREIDPVSAALFSSSSHTLFFKSVGKIVLRLDVDIRRTDHRRFDRWQYYPNSSNKTYFSGSYSQNFRKDLSY